MIKKLIVTMIVFTAAYFSAPAICESFDATGSMTNARYAHTETLLPNGKVLVTGGNGSAAELYDPANGTFSLTGNMTSARQFHKATLLPNGKVLITGGRGSGNVDLNTAELYDSATGIFSGTGSMTYARERHAATLLPNGKALITGGYYFDAITDYPNTAELYDPATGTFSLTGLMSSGRESHTATLLPNGKALVTGGNNGSYLLTAELYDFVTGLFTATGNMSSARVKHTASLLTSGKVLVTGGQESYYVYLNTAELYDPGVGAGEFSSADIGNMSSARNFHTATLLPNGKVFVAGGFYNDGSDHYLDTAELYDHEAKTFSSAGNMTNARYWHTATLLPNGKTLIAGGRYYDGTWHALETAELYTPEAWTCSSTMYRLGGVTECYPNIQEAYNAMSNETMQIQALIFTGDLLLDQNRTVKLAGGYASDFTFNLWYTVVSGTMTIKAGTATVEKIIIK